MASTRRLLSSFLRLISRPASSSVSTRRVETNAIGPADEIQFNLVQIVQDLDVSDAVKAAIRQRLCLPQELSGDEHGRLKIAFGDPTAAAQSCGVHWHGHMLMFVLSERGRASSYCLSAEHLADENFELLIRAIESIVVINQALGRASLPVDENDDQGHVFFETGDFPTNRNGVIAYEREAGNNGVILVPDLYYVLNKGYVQRKQATYPSWSEKAPAAIWRGSSTGQGR